MKKTAFFCTLFCLGQLVAQTPAEIAERWRSDILFVQKELPARHPGLFRHLSPKQFEKDLANLMANFEGRTNLQVALELQAALARAKDAQTSLDLTPVLQQGKVIPVGYGWYDGGMYVSGTVKRFGKILGAKVLKINDHELPEVLRKVGRFSPLENEESLRKDALQWLRFPSVLRYVGFASTDTLYLTLEDKDGKTFQEKVYPLDFQSDKNGMQPMQVRPQAPDLRWQPVEQIYRLEWLAADSIVALQYNACYSREMALAAGDSAMAAQLPPFQPLADSILTLMRQHPGARFFFDLRFNPGGLGPGDGQYLLQQLAANPEINQKNRLFVAINRYTLAAALQVAVLFREQSAAQLIGEPPAQSPNHFEGKQTLVLPNFRLQINYPTYAVERPQNVTDTLQPDVVIELPFEQFRLGKDPVLDFVRRQK